jgi:hypothetical protein
VTGVVRGFVQESRLREAGNEDDSDSEEKDRCRNGQPRPCRAAERCSREWPCDHASNLPLALPKA